LSKLLIGFPFVIFYWVGPEDVTEKTRSGWLTKSIYLVDILNLKVKVTLIKAIDQHFLTVSRSGEIPPCTAMNFLFTMHATESESKVSIKRS
jgi:hypothetical protein